MKSRAVFAVTCLALLVPQISLACGDSLYRVGKGMPYRTYTTPLPGNLLIYATTDGAAHLAEALAESGHTVYLVSTTSELEKELAKGSYDVVIAPYVYKSEVLSVELSGTSFLPVAVSSEEKREAKRDYKYVVQSGDDLVRYLKSIHKTLKSRA